MVNINLLPWREEQRKERNRTTTVIGAVLLVLLANTLVSTFRDGQNARNRFLENEIAKLDLVIKEINELRDKRDALLSRMEVIQQLQRNRSKIVHIFDDLVRKLPEGVYYDEVKKRQGNITMIGKAQSNGRVSALMRNLDSSDWFTNTSLQVVDVLDDSNLRVSQFNLDVREESKVDQGTEFSGEVR